MKTRVIVNRILFALYLAAIIWLCIHNFHDLSRFPKTVFGLHTDKIVHFIMFLPMPFLAYLSYDKRKYTASSSVLFILGAATIGLLLAAGTEIAQNFLPYRTFDYKDLLADSIAIGVGCLPVLATDLKKNSKHNHKRKHKH